MNNNVKRKLGCFLLSFALAATVTDVFADISQAEITRRMDALERSINSMQKQMYNSMAEKTAVGSSKANSIDKTKDLLDEIRTMHAEIDKIEDRSKKLKNEFREFKTDVSKKISTIESASPKNINKISDDAYIINNLSKEIEFNTVEGASKVISTAASDTQKYEIPPEVAYQNAYITLKRKNTSGQVDYDKAQNDFETFIKQYPQSVLVGNAYYWIGQIYMQQKSYNKAAIEYLNGYKATPTSGRAMHNLIGLADALMQLGKTKEVCSTLNKLFNDFTDINSELKRNADKMYNDAGCNKCRTYVVMTMPKIERDTITNLVLNKCITNDNNLIANFLSIFQHLYQYEIFKNILDIVVTKCATNQLHFKLQDSRFFDLDAGNCLTMVEDEGYVSLPSQHTYVSGNSTQLRIRKKKYIITIKKMSCDVIIHEIGHMIEQELSSVLNLKQFSDVIMYEIYNPNTTSMHLHDLLNSVFVGQLKGYPQSQHTSELFARFFQVFAGANEVAFQSSLGSRYRLCDVIAVFPKTIALLEEQLAGNWNELVDQTISMESKKYLRNISDMKEQWTDRRITATHQQSDVKSKWSKNIKSIKSDPFK